jgi:hypothetical protein
MLITDIIGSVPIWKILSSTARKKRVLTMQLHKGCCALQKRDKTGYHYVAQKVAYLAGFGTVVTSRNNLNLLTKYFTTENAL